MTPTLFDTPVRELSPQLRILFYYFKDNLGKGLTTRDIQLYTYISAVRDACRHLREHPWMKANGYTLSEGIRQPNSPSGAAVFKYTLLTSPNDGRK